MKLNERLSLMLVAFLAITVMAGRAMSVPRGAKNHVAPDRRSLTEATDHQPQLPPDSTIHLTDVVIDEEEIPDSLLHPRWKIQRTVPISLSRDTKKGELCVLQALEKDRACPDRIFLGQL